MSLSLSPTRMLDKLTADLFRPLEGERIQVTLPSGVTCEGVIRSLRVGQAPSPNIRAPFSFLIEVPRDASSEAAQQGNIRIAHSSFGDSSLEVFAVPLQPKDNVANWEVVFG